MSVHYKFKTALEYDTVTFDGLHISVKDLKKAIFQQKKIGKTLDFDLQITNAQTKETYTDENALIPKNTSLVVARVPLTQQQKKQWEREKLLAGSKGGDTGDQNALGQVDISSLNLSEDDKIKTMMSQATSDYDPSNYVKVRGGNQVGQVPPSYICFKCHQRGHWIKDCPAENLNLGMGNETIKKSTGIPRSFMIAVEGPQVPGARMTPSGGFAVPVIDHQVYKEKKIEKPPFLPEKEKPAQAPSIPEDLICGICQDLLQDAVMVPCCGISFCDECIRNVLVDSEDSQCPDCSEKDVSPDTLIPNRFLRTSVNSFKNKTGYVKSKTQVIKARPPSPPRPSLPDFVPPPEYVDPASSSGKTDNHRAVKPETSPFYYGSPGSALQIHHSPFQNQSTPESPNSQPLPDKEPYQHSSSSYPRQQYSNIPASSSSDRYRQGPYHQNFRHPPPNYSNHFTEPSGVQILTGHQSTRGGQVSDISHVNRERRDRQKERLDIMGVRKEIELTSEGVKEETKKEATDSSQDTDSKTSPTSDDKNDVKPKEAEIKKPEKAKKSGMEVDDISSVSSTASEEPPPPVEKRRPEGEGDPSQGPSYAIPSLFSGQHPVTLPIPGSSSYPPPRSDAYAHSGSAEERSSTPTVDERLEMPPMRPAYDPYRPPNYMGTGYDQHYGMPPMHHMPYDPNMMYDRGFRGHHRGPRMHRGRYAMRQPPPPGSRPITPPQNEEEAFLAFQRMLKEKEERDKRKNEKLKASRRTNSRSRSRSAARSRRSFSGARSRSRSRSRTPARRSRSRSKKRSRSRSRSFVISRSRSRSYSRSPLHERNYSPRKYYSPRRSPYRYDRYESGYGHWNQDHYRRGGYRGRGRGRFFSKNSPPRGHDHQSYNRYRDENYVTSPTRHYKSPNRYYDQRPSPRHNEYSRDSRDRDYRSYDRDTESAARDRNTRRRSHSGSPTRDRDKEYRHRSGSRRSSSRRYSPNRKGSQARSDRSKDSKHKSPDKRKDYDAEKEGRHRSRERRSYDGAKDKRAYSRDRSKEYDRRHGKSRDRSRSRDKSRHDRSRSRDEKRRRSPSHEKRKRSTSSSRKRRSSSRHRRSISRYKEEKRSRSADDRSSEKRRKKSESVERHNEKRSVSKSRETEVKRSPSREKSREGSRQTSPQVEKEEEEEKKEKKKDKEKKKRKKEKETEEERAARKKRKKEKKEEKKRKQELKAASEMKSKTTEEESTEEKNTKSESSPIAPERFECAPNFVSTFKEIEPEENAKHSVMDTVCEKLPEEPENVSVEEDRLEPGEIVEQDEAIEIKDDGSDISMNDSGRKAASVITGDNSEEMDAEISLRDENVELEIHASYENLLEEPGDDQKKGILAPVPEKSKWELEENASVESNSKQKANFTDVKSPEASVKVTREVIKRAENAIFKKAVNALREPSKKTDKEDRKERKLITAPERDRSKEKDPEVEKPGRRVVVPRDKDKIHRSTIQVVKTKPEIKRTINSLQITVPVRNDNEDERNQSQLQRKEDNITKSSPPQRISIKERLGSKVEKVTGNSNSHVRTVEKRIRNLDRDDDYGGDLKTNRRESRPTLSSTVEAIDSKRTTIDEAHFVPNYDESSDEEENGKSRHGSEKEAKQTESKKRPRSSSESSEESVKKHKKKKSKSKKKKQKKSKKHVSNSSDSSDSEREKKKHKKSKKKKKSKH